MPTWLRQQLKRAYLEKDRYQIKVLNQCWFYYKEKESEVNY
ncbi:cortex morphogenetic protein CmpA [Halalkalibacter wakoensis]|nr:cortex morphogenetic protein CmpA [Halalkalibacter wakoensis]